jgi:hypothetical protein
MSILEAALGWAARGFRVFPITPGDKVPPRGISFTNEATTDPDKIRTWWTFNPDYNYGVTGGDGWLIVDVDAAKNGYASLIDLDLPDTLTVKTPGGGMHLYYRGPDVANSVDRIAPGIDIRSHHGYVVGPGSYFADPGGKKGYSGRYTVAADLPVADAPVAFVLAAGEPKRRSEGAALSTDAPDDIVYAIHYLLKDAPAAIEGRGGNNTTFAVAARLTEIGISPERATDLMLEHWNERCLPPWDREDLATICRNAGNYAQSQQGAASPTLAAAEFDKSVVIDDAPAKTAAGKFDKVFSQRKLTPIEKIPPRDWVVHRLLMRSEATVLSGPGGVGKSGFSLALAAHGAVGKSFAGYAIPKPFKTIVYNLEDSRHEMEARLYAACAVYGFDPVEVERHVLLWPGRELRFRVMTREHLFAMQDIQEIARLTRQEGFDAMILDPLVSVHHEEENDNSAMGDVMDAINGLARLAHLGVLALHHTAKGNRQAGDAGAARGAGNITNAVRIASTIYAADEADAALYGFGEGYKARYVRIDDAKTNNAAMETKPLWLEKQGFPLPNGDSSYALRIMEASASAAGEGRLIAEIIAAHMDKSSTMHLTTHDAAKVLTEADTYFRERVPASGNLGAIKALVEMRLSTPVTLDSGVVIAVQSKTEPGEATARRFVIMSS